MAANCCCVLGDPKLALEYYDKVLEFQENTQARVEQKIARNVFTLLEVVNQEMGKQEYLKVGFHANLIWVPAIWRE